ncbi:MAG: glycosyltransferase [Lachnospiraceae bacterium]|jgi:glycosyltransferase involved in cell wall biosynthesis|nr:glycosyltransferase [Lachnospiraceae bacterium]
MNETENTQKITLIGPVYPYTGGIAHHSALLYRALSANYRVSMISYKFLYPRFLFKRKQTDHSSDRFKIDNTNYLIHTANPFNWIRSAFRLRKDKAAAIVIQWWHPYFAPCYYLLCRLLRHSKIIFICHNIFPHERFPLDRFLTKLVLRQGDRFIVQSHQDENDLLSLIPDAHYRLNPHPTYNAFKLTNMSRSDGRLNIGMGGDIPMLLFFGFVREYKGLKHLLAALPAIKAQIPAIQLWVVGDFAGDKAVYTQMMERLDITDRVRIVDGYIPDEEIEQYFTAADLIVLPYETATQSGIVQIAYGFEKPVVVTRVGGLPDVVRDGQTGLVVEPADPAAIAQAVIRFFTENMRDQFTEKIRETATEFSWERMAEQISQLISD